LSIAIYSLKHLVRVFGSKLLCDISAKHILGYQARRRREQPEGRTINMEVGVLRQIFASYKLWDSLAVDVHMLPERKDIGRALTDDEEPRLLAATLKNDSARHTATVLALNTATRKDELRLLQWKQIDWKERTVTVGKSKSAAGTGRVIPLNLLAFHALVKWAGRSPQAKPEHYIFPWRENQRVIPSRPVSSSRTAWRDALKRAGLKLRPKGGGP
jgi:integrase